MVGRIGEEPYTEPTPRQKRIYHDFDPDDASIRLRSASVREVIDVYMPPEKFNQWVDLFMDTLDYPAHYEATRTALDNVPIQLNMRPPDKVATTAVVREYLSVEPSIARFALGVSEQLRRASDYPDLVLALGLFQGMYRPYLDNLYVALTYAELDYRISPDQYQNRISVLNGPFRQFNEFVLFATILPLTVLHYEDAVDQNSAQGLYQSQLNLMTDAITRAFETFTARRLLRTDFDDSTRMICPANQHLRYAKENKIIERIYGLVLDRQETPPIRTLLQYAKHTATVGSYLKTGNFWRVVRDSLEKEKNARGGAGL